MELSKEQKRLGRAQMAASACIRAICQFVAAAQMPTAPRENAVYRKALLAEAEFYSPYQSLTVPLIEARNFAAEEIAPACQILPRHSEGVGARRQHPRANNYHELAQLLADDLREHLVDVDSSLLFPMSDDDVHRWVTSQNPKDAESASILRLEKLIISQPYGSLYEFQEGPAARFLRDDWRFCAYNFEAIQDNIFREFETANASLCSMHSDVSDQRQSEKTGTIAVATEEPPLKCRWDGAATGALLGPITGNRGQLGYAIASPRQYEKFDKNKMREYRKKLHAGIDSGKYWARKTSTSKHSVELYCTTKPDFDRTQTRIMKTQKQRPKEA